MVKKSGGKMTLEKLATLVQKEFAAVRGEMATGFEAMVTKTEFHRLEERVIRLEGRMI